MRLKKLSASILKNRIERLFLYSFCCVRKYPKGCFVKVVIQKTCFKERFNWSQCSSCVQACPKEAIEPRPKGMALDATLCDQCGACVLACPAGAIDGAPPLRNIEDEILYSDQGVLPSIKELLAYYHAGIRQIHLNHAHQAWLPIVNQTNHKITALGLETFEIKQNNKKIKHVSSARRSLLGLRRKLPISIKNAPLKRLFTGHAFYNLTVDENNCSLCGACEHICPEHAIKVDKESFTLHTILCTGCSLCVDACPEKAIALTEHISQQKFTQYELQQQACPSCAKDYPDFKNKSTQIQKQCPTCKLRQKVGLPPEINHMESISSIYSKRSK